MQAEVDVVAIADHVIGQTAGLSALASIGTAATERLTGETLPGVGHAQRSMHKHLQWHGGLFSDRVDFLEREFTGHHHPLHTELLGKRDGLAARERHLGGCVEWQLRADLPQPSCPTYVLH